MAGLESLDLLPVKSAAGSVRMPGSKSISNRVLLLAALSKGETLVQGLLASDDTSVMLGALKVMGCTLTQTKEGLIITGIQDPWLQPQSSLPLICFLEMQVPLCAR